LYEGNRWRFPSYKPICAAYTMSDYVELSPRALAQVNLTLLRAGNWNRFFKGQIIVDCFKIYVPKINPYSYFNVSAGFVNAALMAW
jgi:hypothetical protein